MKKEEVCKALSENFKCEVYFIPRYTSGMFSFYLKNGKQKTGGDDKTIVTYETTDFDEAGHQVKFYEHLPLYLIEMIVELFKKESGV